MKILVMNNNLRIGGVQKSMENFIDLLVNENVTVALLSNEIYKKGIPQIKLSKNYEMFGYGNKELLKKSRFLWIVRSCLVAWKKYLPFKKYIYKLLIFKKVEKKFDIAISFLHSTQERSFYGGVAEIVLEKIDANYKILLIHNDVESNNTITSYNQKVYERYDLILCVSESVLNKLLFHLPNLKDKTKVLYNNHNIDEIIFSANLFNPNYNENYVNMVTVARLSSEKGILEIVEQFKSVIERNPLIHWHIVGDGNQKQKITSLIEKNELTNNITLHGEQVNPYPFIKSADFFFLPSHHEAAPMVFDEASILKVPILAFETLSAKEIIEKNRRGKVVYRRDEILEEILNFSSSKENLKKYSNNMKSFDIESQHEILQSIHNYLYGKKNDI